MAKKLLMIPGPTEFHPSVYEATAKPTLSHVAPGFIAAHGRVLKQLRHVVLTTSGQPFLIGANASIGWDLFAANCVLPGQHVLVINTGYFGDSFGDCLATYGAEVTHLRGAPVGAAPSCADVTTAMKQAASSGKPFAAVTITHVDTSSGVLSPVEDYAKAIHSANPDALIFVDGVCATGAEELRFDEWGIDGVLTGAQKALGAPPGVSITVLSQRALKIAMERPVASVYFASVKRWLPIMQAYEEGKPSYFSTPPINCIMGLSAALDILLGVSKLPAEGRPLCAGTPSEQMGKVFAAHKDVALRFKKAMAALGLSFVPVAANLEAHTLSAIKLPGDLPLGDLLKNMGDNGIIVAGGLHKDIKTTYFRIGHMGHSTFTDREVPAGESDVAKTVRAVAVSIGSHAKISPDEAVKVYTA